MADRDREVGQAIADLRGGMPQQQLADRMREYGWKWSQATVWAVEKGERPLRLLEAKDVAAILSVSLDVLLEPGGELAAAMERVMSARDRVAKFQAQVEYAQAELRKAHDVLASALEEATLMQSRRDRARDRERMRERFAEKIHEVAADTQDED